MIEFMNIFGGSVGSFLKAVVRESIHNYMVIFFDESFDYSKAGEPSCRIYKERLDTPELCKLFFELHVISEYENLKYLVAPKAKGLPAELTPKLVAASMAASLAKSFLANPR